jgi:two-component system sensor histidine kinase/response regulator
MNPEIIQNSRVLILDDQEANRLLLQRILEHHGYRHFRCIGDSSRAIEEFQEYQPDLLLLDLMMPKVNGYAVLNQLRAQLAADTYMPVLVITADISHEAKQKALTLGAKDFLTKPIDATEAALRIYNLLETRWLYRGIQLQNRVLEETVVARTAELREAHRRLAILDEAKSDFLKLISHEFRTPLNGLLGTGELVLDELGATSDISELRDMFSESRERILSILDDALLLSQIEVESHSFSVAPVHLDEVLNEALQRTIEFADSRNVELPPTPKEFVTVLGDPELLVKALQSLLETAVKFSKPREAIALSIETVARSRSVIIDCPSGRLSEPALDRFFDLFSIGEAATAGRCMGLGPPVASRILALFGGSAAITNLNPCGIRLTASCRPTAN